MSERLTNVGIQPLESGYVVKRDFRDEYDETDYHRTAEPTLQGALTLAARALGYRGVIRFDDEPRTVEVPVMNAVVAAALGVPFDDEEPNLRAGTAIKPDDLL
jgi:hypothetical protein